MLASVKVRDFPGFGERAVPIDFSFRCSILLLLLYFRYSSVLKLQLNLEIMPTGLEAPWGHGRFKLILGPTKDLTQNMFIEKMSE
jgi:hypothetical protein